MDILTIIKDKKNNKELTKEQIEFFVKEYAINETIEDYQASSLLMAMRLNGLSVNETIYLTQAFIDNSEKYNFIKTKNELLIDKHSSGGVGDKISILLLPILGVLGYGVPKMSGRGLGHTGGTIDKLDSIHMNTAINMEHANRIYQENNIVIMQQTDKLVPADRKIYALRDVTSTVDCFGLIASSILAKKFVINSDYIFIDLKVGNGALIDNIDDAYKLANLMLEVANAMKRKLSIVLTNMNQPLGYGVGNLIEIIECIDFLTNKKQCPDLKNLVYELVSEILITTKRVNDKNKAFELIDKVINNNSAYLYFEKWVKSQGGDLSIALNNEKISDFSHDIIAQDDGYLTYKSSSVIGEISVQLGAGRKSKADKIDFSAGIMMYKKHNDYVKKGEKIATLYSSKPINNAIIDSFNNNLLLNKLINNDFPIIINTLFN